MAEDDNDRANEAAAEREAEIESEMKRVGQDPDQVSEGSDSLGTQNAESGSPRDEGEAAGPVDADAAEDEDDDEDDEEANEAD